MGTIHVSVTQSKDMSLETEKNMCIDVDASFLFLISLVRLEHIVSV